MQTSIVQQMPMAVVRRYQPFWLIPLTVRVEEGQTSWMLFHIVSACPRVDKAAWKSSKGEGIKVHPGFRSADEVPGQIPTNGANVGMQL
jgi:hypothetical protein